MVIWLTLNNIAKLIGIIHNIMKVSAKTQKKTLKKPIEIQLKPVQKLIEKHFNKFGIPQKSFKALMKQMCRC